MQEYKVSARKYRPYLFKDILGQSHITTTLQHAIKEKKLGHALLFCGPRGVGKTTCARVLAKTMHCKNITSNIEACGNCKYCKAFQEQRLLNIYEFDAASNNSVDDIRSLVEKIRYAPQEGKYKIYIIDEVHMLSNAAFNAFLKTLEEPPPYVLFILATTEKNKIIPTILSRCQIFDFRRIQPQDIVQQLIKIAQDNHITYNEAALYLIAEKSDGAMRDALSMFDLILAYSEHKQAITYKNTTEHLHILDYEYYLDITKACYTQNIAQVFAIYNEVYAKGFDGKTFLQGLGEHFRNLFVCRDLKTKILFAFTQKIFQKYEKQAKQLSEFFLLESLNTVHKSIIDYTLAKHQRLHIEICLLSLCKLGKKLTEPSKMATSQVNVEIQDQKNDTNKIPKKLVQPPAIIKLPQIKQLKQEAKDKINKPRVSQPFNKTSILPHWNKYKNENKTDTMLEDILNQEFNVQGHTIILLIAHSMQEHVFMKYKKGLIHAITKNMQLEYTIDIQLKHKSYSENNSTKKPYTDPEKLAYLKKKYPNIVDLQKTFLLETT